MAFGCFSILAISVVNLNPDTDPNPAFQVNPCPDTDPGIRWAKTEKYSFFSFFDKKNAIYLSLVLYKGCPLSKLQKMLPALKREHPALQKMKFINYFLSGSGSTTLLAIKYKKYLKETQK